MYKNSDFKIDPKDERVKCPWEKKEGKNGKKNKV